MTESTEQGREKFVALYDQTILHPMTRVLYDGSGFYNVGDWSDNPPDFRTACAALVDRHVAVAALDEPGLAILDVGCGLGDSTACIAKACRPDSSLTGVNISDAQIADARSRHPGLSFVCMDAVAMSFAAQSLDRLIAVESVLHFNSRATFFDKAMDVLKPGGLLVLTDVLFGKDSDPWDWWVPAVNRQLALSGYGTSATTHGFEVLRIEDITASSWTSFCAHLRSNGREEVANRIEPWVEHYILAVLRKPAK